MQLRCRRTSTHAKRWACEAMASVHERVEPLTPHVMEMKSGSRRRHMRSIQVRRFSRPGSVLGGKNSSE